MSAVATLEVLADALVPEDVALATAALAGDAALAALLARTDDDDLLLLAADRGLLTLVRHGPAAAVVPVGWTDWRFVGIGFGPFRIGTVGRTPSDEQAFLHVWAQGYELAAQAGPPQAERRIAAFAQIAEARGAIQSQRGERSGHSRERKAYHEAGHAVGYWWLGMELEELAYVGDNAHTIARRTHDAERRMVAFDDRAWINSLTANGAEVHRGDLRLERSACRLVDGSGVHDDGTHLEAVREQEGAGRALELWDEAVVITERSWAAIEEVAARFQTAPTGRLDRDELERLRMRWGRIVGSGQP